MALQVPNAAVGEAFNVGVKFGDVLVGRLYVLNASCKSDVDARVTKAELSLSQALEGVDSGDVAAVVGLLKEKLTYSVTTLKGLDVPADKVYGLRIVVQEATITLAKDITEFPIFGEKVAHPEVFA